MTDPFDAIQDDDIVCLVVTYDDTRDALRIIDFVGVVQDETLKAAILDAMVGMLGDDCGESEIFH